MQGRGFDAEGCQEVRIAEVDRPAIDLAGGAFAGRRVELVHIAQINIAFPGGPHDRVGQRMLAGALDARGKPQNLALFKACGRHDRDHLRLALGQRSRLVDHQGVDLLHALERFGIPDQHTGQRAATDADHDRHRRRKPKRAGTGNDENADGGDQAECHPGFRAVHSPDAKCDQGHDDDCWHEPAGYLIGQPLDRRARALRLRHHLGDLRKQGIAAFSARITKLPD